MAEEAPTGGERTEAPSSKRREDFRKKGQVAQSKEVQTATLFTIVLLFWIFYMPVFWRGINDLLTSFFQGIGNFQSTDTQTIALFWFIIQKSALLLAPLFLLVLIIGFFSSFFQIGWLFTTQPLVPDFSKLDPIKGFGRFFSRRSLIEVLKSMAKVALIAWVGYSTVLGKFGEALLLADTTVGATVSFLAETAALILAKICAVLIFIAFLDFLFVRWEMEEKMKMTKQELKEEYKEMEGDPHIKAQIRQIQQEMARKRMMAEVPKADVIVTNPTHISVAIRYSADEMDAPMIIAKGSDIVAMKIREIAREHEIPIIENPPVARLLHKLELNSFVPENLFKAVAEILAHVYSLKQR
ncbi:flagellar biosynthesis protein FlhB [Desulfopila aestuarii]|uniref:Flagellar biosynthetic protein FlhB n=1 Tax=Desulfopila aestuarii DSM 18488 TaxID=1121416 RepID=A0A1M7YDS8_9BACT|nr:flagellar biosynthesis protein FlhB [Desulfopila aestuarii]SHO50739.1 flagellar biosynthetic protein FlhB [Desulfopila aestuarii DSM 18488]